MSRPFIHLNFSVCEDGRMASEDGGSLEISCQLDWHRVHRLREKYDAVAVGARTWLEDQPRLTVRRNVIGRAPFRQPSRVVFAGSFRCEIVPDERKTFVVGRHPPGPEHVHVPCRGRQLVDALESLRRHGVRSLLVEGGPTLLSSFLEQEVFDRLTAYVPTHDPRSAREAVGRALSGLPALSAERFGAGTVLNYTPGAPADNGSTGHSAAELLRLDEAGFQELLRDKLTYLEPESAGGAGDHRSERIALMGPIPLPLYIDGELRRFSWYVFGRVQAGEVIPDQPLANSALVLGAPDRQEVPLVRIHSGCHTGDVFSSMRCDCGAQLEKSLLEITEEDGGVAIYLTEHEGRGIGLWAKAAAYLLQDDGHDTYEANLQLGYPADARTYGDAAAVLRKLLRSRRIRLLSNNPVKRQALEEGGFTVTEMRSLVSGHNEINRRYIEAKARQGHVLPGGDSVS